MKTIWKYEVSPVTELDMPAGAEVLDLQVQNGVPAMWALVDPNAVKVKRFFRMYGTGHEMPNNPGKYVRTFQTQGLVFHVFEYLC